MKCAIITAADSNHFELVKGLYSTLEESIRKDFDLFFLDAGLIAADREFLQCRGITVVPLKWDVQIEAPAWLRALIAKPFLPEYVPGYDVYIWIDGDCWVQQVSSILDLKEAALANGFAAVSLIHAGYRQFIAKSPRAPGIPIQSYYGYLNRVLLDRLGASCLSSLATLGGGVWSVSANHGMFGRWQDFARAAYARVADAPVPPWKSADSESPDTLWLGADNPALFHADEVSMNLAARTGGSSPAVLNARYNWACSQAIPVVDDEGVFLDTVWPHEPIQIVHQSAATKSGLWRAPALSGGYKMVSLRAQMTRLAALAAHE